VERGDTVERAIDQEATTVVVTEVTIVAATAVVVMGEAGVIEDTEAGGRGIRVDEAVAIGEEVHSNRICNNSSHKPRASSQHID